MRLAIPWVQVSSPSGGRRSAQGKVEQDDALVRAQGVLPDDLSSTYVLFFLGRDGEFGRSEYVSSERARRGGVPLVGDSAEGREEQEAMDARA